MLFRSLPFFFGALALEVLWAYKVTTKHYESVDFWTSMRVMLLTVFVDLIPKAIGIGLMFAVYSLSPLKGLVDTSWYWWVLLFFLDDLTYYCFHRGNHEIRLLWAGHVSHHSSQYYNLGTALRQGVGERILKYPFWVPLAAMGFHPAMIVTMLSVSLIYQYWLHTEAFYKLPRPVEFIFNTPSHHRVHHGSNIRYLDRNHGATLIIWDRLFGTFSGSTRGARAIRSYEEHRDPQRYARGVWRVRCYVARLSPRSHVARQAGLHFQGAGMEPRWTRSTI